MTAATALATLLLSCASTQCWAANQALQAGTRAGIELASTTPSATATTTTTATTTATSTATATSSASTASSAPTAGSGTVQPAPSSADPADTPTASPGGEASITSDTAGQGLGSTGSAVPGMPALGPGSSASAHPDTFSATPGGASGRAAPPSGPLLRSVRAAPAWESLNTTQQHWLAPLAKVWHELPASDRHAWIQLSRQLPRLSQQAQAQARERMQQWSAFTPQQRQAARENFRLAQKLNESRLSQGQLQALWDRYQDLTPEQRAVLRAAGQTATTAARHAGAATPLAKEASRPLPPVDRHGRMAQ